MGFVGCIYRIEDDYWNPSLELSELVKREEYFLRKTFKQLNKILEICDIVQDSKVNIVEVRELIHFRYNCLYISPGA